MPNRPVLIGFFAEVDRYLNVIWGHPTLVAALNRMVSHYHASDIAHSILLLTMAALTAKVDHFRVLYPNKDTPQVTEPLICAPAIAGLASQIICDCPSM